MPSTVQAWMLVTLLKHLLRRTRKSSIVWRDEERGAGVVEEEIVVEVEEAVVVEEEALLEFPSCLVLLAA